MFWQNKELFLGPIAKLPIPILLSGAIWSVFWTGIALWKASKNNQKYWFVALLISNTLGLLEIIYLAFFQKKKK